MHLHLLEKYFPVQRWISASVQDNFLKPMYTLCSRSEYNVCIDVSICISDILMHLFRDTAGMELPYLDCDSFLVLVSLAVHQT